MRAISLLAGLLGTAHSYTLSERPWMDKSLASDKRAELLVKNMSFSEQVAMLHGPLAPMPCCECHDSNGTIKDKGCAYTGNVVGNSRLNIPPINMNDGPQGFREAILPGTTTAWPSGLTMAASWNVESMYKWGDGMGKEFFAKGANVQLGPGVCLARVPRNGRNFEYLSGEDPFLGYTLVQPVIKGIQNNSVVANAKHYINNNQETNRNSVSEVIDERTRVEMYQPVFAGAIEAGVGSIMCSYNKINGVWSCENPETLGEIRKAPINYKGYVMSDWGATHSTSIAAGLDVEMPGAGYMNEAALKKMDKEGVEKVRTSTTRILTAMFAAGVMDAHDADPLAYDFNKHYKNVTTLAAAQLARALSAEATVLLKNDGGLLPLPHGKKIAILGLADANNALTHAGGSGEVTPSFTATPLSSMKSAYQGGSITYLDGTDVAACAAAAKAADVAIVFAGTLSGEGSDRQSLSLDDGISAKNQNALIEAVAAANPDTVVVLTVPGAILTPWKAQVKAMLTNFMPGQQCGNAITDVLLGKVNPSGKLPLTFPNVENETEFAPSQWPGVPDAPLPTPKSDPPQACTYAAKTGYLQGFDAGSAEPEGNPQCTYSNYTEKLLVGYRYYDAHKIEFTTGFPFGHGLSYTEFKYSDFSVSAKGDGTEVNVKVTLDNTGKVAGSEVVQVYVEFPASAGEPPRQLKGFTKKTLDAGSKAYIQLALTERDFSIWDVETHKWAVAPGVHNIYVGTSSRDNTLAGTVTKGH